MQRRLDPARYTIAWIAPLPIEAEAAIGMLDVRHDGLFESTREEDYHYIGGTVNDHDIVIVTQPIGQVYGTASAAALASQVKARFTNLWFSLLVGVAAGLPNLEPQDSGCYRDIRLGDVLVAVPSKENTGIVHYSLGRDIDGDFQIVGRQSEPPKRLTAAFGYMQLQYENPYKDGNLLANYIKDFRASRLAHGKSEIPCLSQAEDILYSSNVSVNDEPEVISRIPRSESERTQVFYGCLGSGDSLMRNSERRDNLRDKYNLIGLEMEAAGVMNILPCGVIRGVSDYGDRHKSKDWQPYAAMVAAAYAKGVLHMITLAQNNDQTNQQAARLRFPSLGLGGIIPKYGKKANAKKLIHSLGFEHIEDRYNNIRPAHLSTCKWLGQNEKHRRWLDTSQILDHHGILWLKGNPGSGKFTLVKYALSEAQHISRDDVHIAFFFNARGTSLEKTILGLYRSLLLQLLWKLPKAEDIFSNFSILELPQAPRYAWTVPQLKNIFGRTIQAFEHHRVWIFVDALDECDEIQVRDMISFFSLLGHQAVISGKQIQILFASRYYPRITIRKSVELRLEDESEHFKDVELYVQSELKLGQQPLSSRLRAIQSEIVRRSSGIFIWVVLVIQILNIECDHGRITMLEEKLKEIPSDLNELLYGIFTRDNQNIDSMRLCIQWVLFAKHPVSREELYCAILSGTHPTPTATVTTSETTIHTMDAFILSCSKGLVELTRGYRPIAQFIHESCKDYLLTGNGMRHIHKDRNVSFTGAAHDVLKGCCINYLLANQQGMTEAIKTESTESVVNQLPFVNYAISPVLFHADAAAFHGSSQEDFLRTFKSQYWSLWTSFYAVSNLDATVRPISKASAYIPLKRWSLLYLFTELNLTSLIKEALRSDPHIEAEAGRYGSPLQAAFRLDNYESISALLTADGSHRKPGRQLSTLYVPSMMEINKLVTIYQNMHELRSTTESLQQFFFRWGTEEELLTLMRSGRIDLNGNISMVMPYSPLCFATGRGFKALTRFMLRQDKVDCNCRDDLGRTPIIRAVQEGYMTIVRLLVELSETIDINARSYEGRSALSYAIQKGHKDIAKFLLEQPGIEINLRDDKGRTPLFYAAQFGRKDIINILIKIKYVDVVSRDKLGHTALSYAALQGHEDVIKQLLATGQVDVNSQDHIHGRTALSLAIEYGYEKIAKALLNDPDIDINVCDKKGRSYLDYAQRFKCKQLERLLVKQMAKADSALDRWDLDWFVYGLD